MNAPGLILRHRIEVGPRAVSSMAVSTDGAWLILTHFGDDSLSLINAAHATAALTVTGVPEPFAVAVSGRRAYISSGSASHDEVLALDADAQRIVAAYPLAARVTDVAVSPNGRHLYACCSAADGAYVAFIDTFSGSNTAVAVGTATTVGGIRVSPDGRRLYVAANGASSAQLVAIDVQRHQMAGFVEIGSPIRDIALGHDGLYVGSCGPDFGTVLDVIDTRNLAITATHKLGDDAPGFTQLTVSHRGERACLVGDQAVTVLSTATHDVLGRITVGSQPSCTAESPDGKRLYIADYAGAVTVAEIAGPDADGFEADGGLTVPHGWASPDLLLLQPAPA